MKEQPVVVFWQAWWMLGEGKEGEGKGKKGQDKGKRKCAKNSKPDPSLRFC